MKARKMNDISHSTINIKKTGQNIKRLFAEKGIKPKDLSKKGIASEQAIYKWLRGDTLPSIDNMILLKSILSLESIDQILIIEDETTMCEEVTT